MTLSRQSNAGDRDCFDDRHLPVVVYSRRLGDRLRRRYWVRCWECSLRFGPYLSAREAQNCRRHIEQVGAREVAAEIAGRAS